MWGRYGEPVRGENCLPCWRRCLGKCISVEHIRFHGAIQVALLNRVQLEGARLDQVTAAFCSVVAHLWIQELAEGLVATHIVVERLVLGKLAGLDRVDFRDLVQDLVPLLLGGDGESPEPPLHVDRALPEKGQASLVKVVYSQT